jgi:hypothetical protein
MDRYVSSISFGMGTVKAELGMDAHSVEVVEPM